MIERPPSRQAAAEACGECAERVDLGTGYGVSLRDVAPSAATGLLEGRAHMAKVVRLLAVLLPLLPRPSWHRPPPSRPRCPGPAAGSRRPPAPPPRCPAPPSATSSTSASAARPSGSGSATGSAPGRSASAPSPSRCAGRPPPPCPAPCAPPPSTAPPR
ncbi:hypothetical protein ACFQ3Z_35560 [Streptomyces nogalater]